MGIANKLKNAITGGDWFIAYRGIDQEKWKTVSLPDNQWCADPFVIEDGSDHYIFVEQYLKDKDKGCIGYFKFMDGEPINQGIIIENTYHMSYPDVFRYKGQYFMIPESSANSTVDLYVADHFPEKWRKVKTLINGQKYVDSTVYQDGEDYYLISYSMIGGYEIHVFALDMEKQEVTLVSKRKYPKNVGRPGGRLFKENDKLMRPAQDCSRKYGEALILYQVDDLNRDGEFVEHEVRRMEVGSVSIESYPERLHQWTSGSHYEVIDVYKEKFDLFHALRILMRSKRK